MDLSLSLMDETGHTEVRFQKRWVRLEYGGVTRKEHNAVKRLVKRGRTLRLALRADEEDVPGDDLKRLPRAPKSGVVTVWLTGSRSAVRRLALETVEEEIKNGKIVMEATKDGSWRVLRSGDLKDDGEPKQLAAASPARGG